MTRHLRRQAGEFEANNLVEASLETADFKGAKLAKILSTDLPSISGDRADISRALRGCVACASEGITSSDSAMIRTLRREGRAVVMIASSVQVSAEQVSESRQLIERNGGTLTVEHPSGEKSPKSVIEIVLPHQ